MKKEGTSSVKPVVWQEHYSELPKLTNKTWPIRSFHPFAVVFWTVSLNLYEGSLPNSIRRQQ